MSIKLMSLIWDDHTGELTGIEKAVLLRMADFAAENGTQIFPSYKRLSEDTGFSESSVKRAIVALIQKKRISKTRRSRKLQHITNLYRINVTVLKEKTIVPLPADYVPVHKSVDKSCTKEGGGVTQTQGVVSYGHKGGVTVTDKPSLDPSLRSSNRTGHNKILKQIEHEQKRKKILEQQLEHLMKKVKRKN